MKRRWIFWGLVIGFVWIVASRFADIKNLAKIISGGQWQWLLAAAAAQVIFYLAFAASYQAAFKTVKVESRLRDLIPVIFGSLFVNVVAPAGGTAGAALFIDDAARRGQSGARAAAGTLLQLVADFSAFVGVLIVGLVYLFSQHDLQLFEVIGAIILLLITVGLSSILLLGLWRPSALMRILKWVQRAVNNLAARFKRPPLLKEDWALENADGFTGAAAAIRMRPLKLAITIGYALIAHFLDLLVLYLLFRAFDQPIQLGPLVAGYAMGILFWIVSITPQGIGIVEGVMALVYTSLGIPGAIATTVSLVFRGLSFWIPLGLGFLSLRQVKSFGAGTRSLAEIWSVRIVALLTAVMGVINMISTVTPSLRGRVMLIESFSPLIVRQGGHLTAALAGFALLLLARNLWRRKRTAWVMAMAVLVISAVSHLIKGLDYEEAALAIGLAIWLFSLRSHFHARSDEPSIWQGLRVLATALVFTLAYGMAGFYLLDRHYSVNFGFWAALRQTIAMFTEFYDPGLQPITGFGRYFAVSIYIIGAISFGYALFMLLRPVLFRQSGSEAERTAAREIVQAYGRSSLAHMLLLDDKAYYFSPGGSLIGYTVKGRSAIALGDPVGPAEDLLRTIEAFRAYCVKNDWQPVFYQTMPDTLAAYKSAGFDAVYVGQEGVVDLKTFSLGGRANKGMRAPYNHIQKMGYQMIVHDPPHSVELMAELRSISDEWLTMMQGREKRFSLGWFDDHYLQGVRVAAVYASAVQIAEGDAATVRPVPDLAVPGSTSHGDITAFASLVPEYQLNEISIDLMRRRREIEPGTMEFLFASLFLWAKSCGFDTFNLGLSALSGVGEQAGDPVIERVMHFIYENVNQFYNFKGLHEFKEKFHPNWSPRFLICDGVANLPTAWLAVVQANSGDSEFPLSVLRKT